VERLGRRRISGSARRVLADPGRAGEIPLLATLLHSPRAVARAGVARAAPRRPRPAPAPRRRGPWRAAGPRATTQGPPFSRPRPAAAPGERLPGGRRPVGSLAGAAHLLDDNTGVLRPAQCGQKPHVEQKGRSWLDSRLSVRVRTAKARPTDPLAGSPVRGLKLEVPEKLPQG
jgi:hypothetical protein